jgi:hypothetical protein
MKIRQAVFNQLVKHAKNMRNTFIYLLDVLVKGQQGQRKAWHIPSPKN